jgi:hypothetical protein
MYLINNNLSCAESIGNVCIGSKQRGTTSRKRKFVKKMLEYFFSIISSQSGPPSKTELAEALPQRP